MKKVLVIVDMQNDFTTGPLGNKECRENIENVIKVVKTNKYDKIICTRDTHDKNYLDTQEGKKLPVKHCLRNTEGWKIVKSIEDTCKESDADFRIIDKTSFGSIDLGILLRHYCDICKEDVEIDFCGVCTGICVISNVAIAKAACPETKISVIEHACACVTPESHQTAIEAMKTFQVDITE